MHGVTWKKTVAKVKTKAEEIFSPEKLELRTVTLCETNPTEESATAEAV